MGCQQSERLVPKVTYTIPTKLLSENATVPTYGSEEAAGMDLYSSEDTVVRAGRHLLIKTDIAMALPQGFYGRVAPRSGLAYKKGIDVFAGVIDGDYRGPIGVILYNSGDEDFIVTKGDRIAQMIITPYHTAMPEPVAELPDTERGAGGFGSTGK